MENGQDMENEQRMQDAVRTYQTLCKYLDSQNWAYDKDEDRLVTHFRVNGGEKPMHFVVLVDAERALVRVMSMLPYKIQNHIEDVSCAVVQANYKMVSGSFDFNYKEGLILYKISASYEGGVQLGEGVFEYLIDVGIGTVFDFTDEFWMIEKEEISLEEFMKKHA